MKLEKIEVLKAFLASWLDYWILQAIGFAILMINEEATYGFWRWALLSFYPFALYLLRRKFTGFSGFVLSHLGLAALLCLIPAPSVMERVFFCLYVAGYAIYSFYIRMKTEKWQDRAMPPLAAGVILTVLVILLYYFERNDLENIFVIFCIAYLVLYFTYNYMLEYIHFVKLNEGSAGYIPVKKMFLSGLKTVVPYSLISGGLLLVVGNATVITDVFNVMKNGMLWILRTLFAGEGKPSQYEAVENGDPTKQMIENMGKMEGEALWIWEVVEKIMVVAIIAAAIFGVIKLYKLVSGILREKFSKAMLRSGEVKEELVDKREKCKVEKIKGQQDKKHVLSIFSNKEKIRKIYKKKIESARKTAGYRNFLKEDKTPDVYSQKSSTARECCESLSVLSLADVYEKARYSNQECDSADVRVAKQCQ